jgi:hypothetical protein
LPSRASQQLLQIILWKAVSSIVEKLEEVLQSFEFLRGERLAEPFYTVVPLLSESGDRWLLPDVPEVVEPHTDKFNRYGHVGHIPLIIALFLF